MDDLTNIHKKVDDYYTAKLTEHGATHQGVDWNSPESQELRFQQIMKIVVDPTQGIVGRVALY